MPTSWACVLTWRYPRKVTTGVGLGAAVIFVLGITVPVNYLLENYVLKEGALSWLGPQFAEVDLSFLSFIMFIAVIASMVQLVEMIVEKFAPALYGALGIFLATYRGKLFYSGWFTIYAGAELQLHRGGFSVFGLGSGVGWFLAIVAIAAIREKIRYSQYSRTSARPGNYVYRNRADGNRLHGLYGY